MQAASASTWLRRALPDPVRRPALEPLSLPLYAIVAGVALLVAAGVAATDFTYDAASLNGPILCLAVLAACALGLRRTGYPAVAGMLEATTLMAAVSAAGAFASLILAASARPYADDWLISADAVLFFGFDWRTAVSAIAGQDALLTGASYVYASLNWQPTLLVLLLFALGRSERCWTFATAWAMTLAATIAVFPFAPALGGYLHFGIQPAAVPGVRVPAAWMHAAILEPVRTGTLRTIGAGVLEGVVTFPSFHAAAAVLLGWGFWGLRWLRWPAAALNAAMFAAAVVIGGHYLVDIVAGGLIAAAAIASAKALMRVMAARSVAQA
jgi:membrane-associated phospholipid phosphatase